MDKKAELYFRQWLIFSQAKGIGPIIGQKLLNRYGEPRGIIEADSKQLSELGLSYESIRSLHEPQLDNVERVLEWLSKDNHHLIVYQDLDYPSLLKTIHSAPLVLFAIGQRDIFKDPIFSIIGSRNPSVFGRKIAEEFAGELIKAGLTICSGLALGIDYHSHNGALKKKGRTIAILGSGLDIIYPTSHKKIAKQIAETGLLVAEYTLGTKPIPSNFPQRNRIISGLSLGVLVVEAAKKSGSLITAQYALEQGREVFAIPSSIHNPLAKGTHSLIKQGAKLVEKTGDILEELTQLANVTIENDNTYDSGNKSSYELDSDYQSLLDNMGYEILSVDELVELSGLTASEVSSMLLVLELKGLVEAKQGSKYCRCL